MRKNRDKATSPLTLRKDWEQQQVIMTKENKIDKHCPFCDSQAKKTVGDWRSCSNDNCRMRHVALPRKEWNERPATISSDNSKVNAGLLKENERLREALKFYAENKHWYEGMACTGSNVILREYGDVAKQALNNEVKDAKGLETEFKEHFTNGNYFTVGNVDLFPPLTKDEIITYINQCIKNIASLPDDTLFDYVELKYKINEVKDENNGKD